MSTFTDLEKKIHELEKRVKELEERMGSSTSATNEVLMEQLYKKAKELVIRHKKATAIFLQRKLYIDYQRATELLNELERNGVISPAVGIEPRKILV